MTSTQPIRASAGLAYGLLGLPLAFVALPLYVLLPNHYAREFGMPLAMLGSVLLAARLFDAFTDPLLGGADALIAWALVALLITYTAYSQLSIAHQSWGARLGGDELQRGRIVAWREGAALVGVVLASVLPALLGLPVMLSVFAITLLLGWWAWTRAPRPAAHAGVA